MSIDLRTERSGGSWVRRFGDHEAAGLTVALNDRSAHVTMTENGILFAVDRQDIPSAWSASIDVVQLRSELLAAIVRRMSIRVLEELLSEIHLQRQRALWDGARETQTRIKEALGL